MTDDALAHTITAVKMLSQRLVLVILEEFIIQIEAENSRNDRIKISGSILFRQPLWETASIYITQPPILSIEYFLPRSWIECIAKAVTEEGEGQHKGGNYSRRKKYLHGVPLNLT